MHTEPTLRTRVVLLAGFAALCASLVALPHGGMASMGEMRLDPATRAHVFVHDHARMVWHGMANMTGQLAALLTLATLVLPYLRRPVATRAHRWIGVAILVLASIHTAIYMNDGSTRGWIPGALAFAFFGAHGATAALKGAFLRAWGPAWWRRLHRGSGWGALALVVEHILLASWHFGLVRWLEG